MRIGLSVWENRIAPVVDVSRKILVVLLENRDEIDRFEVIIPQNDYFKKVDLIAQLNIDLFICGAISKSFEELLVKKGIKILGQTCGPIEAVIEAYKSGQLKDNAFIMPGCCRKRMGQ